MRLAAATLCSLVSGMGVGCALDWDRLDPRAVSMASSGGASEGGTSSVGGSGGAPSSGGSGGTGGTCADTVCDGDCVDLDLDPDHCGDCTTTCGAAEICLAGDCTSPASCEALLAQRAQTNSGVYTLAPEGVEPFEAYCDMATEGGGWTLVASVADNSYFSGVRCSTICGADPATTCDETPFTDGASVGDAATAFDTDHKSPAYASVPFDEMLFLNADDQWVTYDVSGDTVMSWYPTGLENWVSSNNEAHETFSYPAKATNVDLSLTSCGTLRVSFNVEDSDSPIGGSCHVSVKGPVWPRMNNGPCFWDDGGHPWAFTSFYGSNATAYRLWLVR